MFILTISVMLPPYEMRGLYLSPGVLITGKNEKKFIKMIEDGYINTLVFDIKDEWGNFYLETCKKALKKYKKYNVYIIGRLPVFKDKNTALSENGRFSLKTPSGEIWFDEREKYWVNPESREVWFKVIKIAEECFKMGFDEIQFDYIRFPSSTKPYVLKGNKLKILCEFLDTALSYLDTLGWISIDFYGYVCWFDILYLEGQSLKEMGRRVDAVYPMLYPSHFHDSFFKELSKEERTFRIVYESMLNARKKVPDRFKRVVGYIQAFDWKSSRMGKDYIKNQIDAALKSYQNGFILWHAGGDYDLAFKEMIEYFSNNKVAKNIYESSGNSKSIRGY
uniref:DUF4015 domain-containing protein n=1 Tax=candidate division WOR-3 bacterium TaxID=2052148 RepID=A0A7C4Y9W0_UNCW3